MRRLYADEPLASELDETTYALNSTFEPYLLMFPWASFRQTMAAVKMHTSLDLRGPIPSFVHISEGNLHDVNVLDLLEPELGTTHVTERAYLDLRRLHRLHRPGAFILIRAKKNFRSRRPCFAPTNHALGIVADQTVPLDGDSPAQPFDPRL